MALKGLSLLGLKDKDNAEKLIKDSLKLGFKNAICWHFYAIFNKETKNYSQSIKCYLQSHKNDPENYNVLRDISYLQLFLGKFNDFAEFSKKALSLRPTLNSNWIAYAFSQYLIGDYDNALYLINKIEDMQKENIKKQEVNQIYLFKGEILLKLNKYDDCIKELTSNLDKKCSDRNLFYSLIIKAAFLGKKDDIGIEYCKKGLLLNPEDVNYYIWYLSLKTNEKIENYDNLIKLGNDESKSKIFYEILINEIKPQIKKSKVYDRLELVLSSGETFIKLFNEYFLRNIKLNLISFFINVKFIYLHLEKKTEIISNILTKHLESIEKNNYLDLSLTNNEKISKINEITWLYYYASQHYDYFKDLNKALKYINKAIKNIPSVVEFYMLKSKILKHLLLYEESSLSMKKAKELDLSDRYLNAKHAKSALRNDNIDESKSIMIEFVKDPLFEENMKRTQCMWYETECGYCYLKNNLILHSHRMFKNILMQVDNMFEDQNDFYNYSLRRYMLNDFFALIKFMKKIYNGKYLLNSLFYLDIIKSLILKKKDEKDFSLSLDKEYEEIKNNCGTVLYTYKDLDTLIKSIDDDIYNYSMKIQSITKCQRSHFICVKIFLNKNKPILALKSLKFLANNFPNDFYSVEADKLFKQYLLENETKFDNDVKGFINENLPKNIGKYEEENKVKKLMNDLYSNNKYCDEEGNKDLIKQFEDNITPKEIFSNSSLLINLYTYIVVFTSSQFYKKFLNNLKAKVKIEEITEEDIKGNLTFWEEKEEADKLFPNK
jgi:peptide alpha-N-acetyltransferase